MVRRGYHWWALAGVGINGLLTVGALALIASDDVFRVASRALSWGDVEVAAFLFLLFLAMVLPVLGTGLCWGVYRMDPLRADTERMRRRAVLLIAVVLVLFAGMTVTLIMARDFEFELTLVLVLLAGWSLAALLILVPFVLLRIASPIGRELSVADRFG